MRGRGSWTALFALAASPVVAWEFEEVPGADSFKTGPLCELSHQTDEARIWVVFDPSIQEYILAIRLEAGTWPDAPVFAMQFEGAAPLTIETTRQSFDDRRTALAVADSGFGNVLDGLQFNDVAVAILGDLALRIPLDGAAPEVEAFRACPSLSLS